MMKKITLMFALFAMSYGYSQDPLPYDFGTVAAPTTHGIVPDPNDPTPVVTNEVDPDDANNSVLQIVGGGSEWDNAQVTFTTPIDLSDNENNLIRLRFRDMTSTSFPSTHALKFEAGSTGDTEIQFTVNDNDWHTIDLDFPAGLGTYGKMVIFTDFGVAGPTGTYLVDDIELTGAPCVSPVLSMTPIDFSDAEDAVFTGGDNAVVNIIDDGGNDVLEVQGSGQDWDNAQVTFCNAQDLSDDNNNTIRFKMKPMNAGPAEVRDHGVKFEGGAPVAISEFNFTTTGSDWQDIEVDFPGGLGTFPKMIIFVDTGVFGGGGAGTPNVVNDTYLIDDITLDATVLGVEDFSTTSFRAFPNPTNGNWNISGNSVINKVTVYDILGKQVIALEPNATETIINASSLNSGIYFARIEGLSRSKTIKLIKN